MLVSAVVAFFSAAAQPVAAKPPQPAAPTVKTRKVCRTEEAVTGSLTPKRVCVTVPVEASSAPQSGTQPVRGNKREPAPGNASGTSN